MAKLPMRGVETFGAAMPRKLCCSNSLPRALQCPECQNYWRRYMRTYMYRRHAENKVAGMCKQCLKEPVFQGSTRCADCLEYHAQQMQSVRHEGARLSPSTAPGAISH